MILSGTVLGFLWAVTLARLPTLWRDRRQQALWCAIAAITLAKTASFPPVARHLPTEVVPHLFGVVAAFCLLRFVALVTGTGRRWRQLTLMVAVVVTLVALEVAAGGIDTSSDGITQHLAPAAVAYWVVLELYLGVVLVSGTVLFATVARAAPAGLPRAGLAAMSCGLGLISLYAFLKTVLIVLHGFGAHVDFGAVEPTAHAVQASAVALAVAGALVPASRRARAAARAYRDLFLLRPLWKAMRDAFPQVILFTPRRAVIELAGVDDVHLRLYRRVIEIRDGMLALRDHLPERVREEGVDPAVTEARGIALALQRLASGEPAADRPGAWATVGPDMADEVAWLRQVSAAYKKLGRPLSVSDAPLPRPSGSAR